MNFGHVLGFTDTEHEVMNTDYLTPRTPPCIYNLPTIPLPYHIRELTNAYGKDTGRIKTFFYYKYDDEWIGGMYIYDSSYEGLWGLSKPTIAFFAPSTLSPHYVVTETNNDIFSFVPSADSRYYWALAWIDPNFDLRFGVFFNEAPMEYINDNIISSDPEFTFNPSLISTEYGFLLAGVKYTYVYVRENPDIRETHGETKFYSAPYIFKFSKEGKIIAPKFGDQLILYWYWEEGKEWIRLNPYSVNLAYDPKSKLYLLLAKDYHLPGKLLVYWSRDTNIWYPSSYRNRCEESEYLRRAYLIM
jgi:hypothetical protein